MSAKDGSSMIVRSATVSAPSNPDGVRRVVTRFSHACWSAKKVRISRGVGDLRQNGQLLSPRRPGCMTAWFRTRLVHGDDPAQ
jgi:hypothetical protein